MIAPIKVMIAGIGGGSLGTEICKALSITESYEIYGCDVSKTAYGLYDGNFHRTWLVSRENYVSNVLDVCIESGVQFLIPGGEQPMRLLGEASLDFSAAGIQLLANTPEIVSRFSDKDETFRYLAQLGIHIPRTVVIESVKDLAEIGLPCIIKPSTGSGGSVGVFFAVSYEEAMVYAEFIRRIGSAPIAQQYIDDSEGEFTIGVLSNPKGNIIGSIALKRALEAKLSVFYRGRGGLISSGYSQGYIDFFPEICHQAEQIAIAVNSRGPINIQGRVHNGVLLPFEINPRFSASTYLRSMAGFNEIDMLIKCLSSSEIPHQPKIKPGWYLRSLTEQFVAREHIK